MEYIYLLYFRLIYTNVYDFGPIFCYLAYGVSLGTYKLYITFLFEIRFSIIYYIYFLTKSKRETLVIFLLAYHTLVLYILPLMTLLAACPYLACCVSLAKL